MNGDIKEENMVVKEGKSLQIDLGRVSRTTEAGTQHKLIHLNILLKF